MFESSYLVGIDNLTLILVMLVKYEDSIQKGMIFECGLSAQSILIDHCIELHA